MLRRLSTRIVPLALAACAALPAAADAARGRASQEAGACTASRVAVTASTLGTARDATLCLLNRERSERGLRPFRLDPALGRAATAHSRDMVARRYFEHESPNGRDAFDRILATSYVPRGSSWTLGENIGWGTESLAQPAALLRAWMTSPAHRRNILNPRFREVGIGIAVGVPVRDSRLAGQPGATYTTDFGAHS